MHDCVGPGYADHARDFLLIAEIAFVKLNVAWNGMAVPAPKTIHDHDVVAGAQGLLDRDAPDVSGATGDQNPHEEFTACHSDRKTLVGW
jgi:hypothetical protein